MIIFTSDPTILKLEAVASWFVVAFLGTLFILDYLPSSNLPEILFLLVVSLATAIGFTVAAIYYSRKSAADSQATNLLVRQAIEDAYGAPNVSGVSAFHIPQSILVKEDSSSLGAVNKVLLVTTAVLLIVYLFFGLHSGRAIRTIIGPMIFIAVLIYVLPVGIISFRQAKTTRNIPEWVLISSNYIMIDGRYFSEGDVRKLTMDFAVNRLTQDVVKETMFRMVRIEAKSGGAMSYCFGPKYTSGHYKHLYDDYERLTIELARWCELNGIEYEFNNLASVGR